MAGRLDGTGIGVAVIDSGISPLISAPALFIPSLWRLKDGSDQFGHGSMLPASSETPVRLRVECTKESRRT